MLPKFYHTILPISVMSLISGAFPIIRYKNKFTHHYLLHLLSIPYVLFVIIGLCFVAFHPAHDMTGFYTDRVSQLGMQIYVINAFTVTFSTYSTSILKTKDLRNFLEQLEAVHDRLEALGAKFRIVMLIITESLLFFFGLGFVCMLIMMLYIGMQRNFKKPLTDLVFGTAIFSYTLTNVVDLSISFYTHALYRAFKGLNQEFKACHKKYGHKDVITGLLLRSEKLSNDLLYEKLHEMGLLHDKLCDLVDLFNDIYSFESLAIIAQQFSLFMFSAFNCYWRFTTFPLSAVAWFGWFSVKLSELFLKTTVCQKTKDESMETLEIIKDLSVMSWDSKIERKLKVIVLQVSQRRVKFSVCTLFEIDTSLLFTIIASTATYMIILIQFQVASAPINCRFKIVQNGSDFAYQQF